MAPSLLTITVDDPERFPEGTRVGLFRVHDIVGDLIPWARAVIWQIAPGPVETAMTFVTPVAYFAADHTPFVVAARVSGQLRAVRVMAERTNVVAA